MVSILVSNWSQKGVKWCFFGVFGLDNFWLNRVVFGSVELFSIDMWYKNIALSFGGSIEYVSSGVQVFKYRVGGLFFYNVYFFTSPPPNILHTVNLYTRGAFLSD